VRALYHRSQKPRVRVWEYVGEYDVAVSDRTLGADEHSISGESTLALEATLATGGGNKQGSGVQRGSLVDRYVVLDLAGAGAMGMVLVAYDPELDRKVAIKLLKFDGALARARLQREAQALAKLDHRNVVAVYDVGTHDGQLFMAMEFVQGKTLGRWMAEAGSARPHAWREVLRVFGEAGRGLAAAHAAGLVHRDFKPENVMLGDDGCVRVMDFGLARTTSLTVESDESPATDASASHRVAIETMTRTGAVMGTPAYMSLEQFEGKPADARSDQFGFCIALYEALYGQRPFVDATLAQLIESLGSARIKPPAPGTEVPPWLRRVVLRGLAPAPDDRWPSMQALLDALADDPSIRRRKWITGALALALLGGLATAGVVAANRDEQRCQNLDHKLAGVWDDERRAAIEAAILETGLSYAPGTWTHVEAQVDTWTSAWVEARTRACEATARGEQSSELLDTRMACLDRQLTHLTATLDVLARADPTAIENASEAVEKLPTLEHCLLDDRGPARDPLLAAAVDALERRMVEAEALDNLGKADEGLALMIAIHTDAEALGDEATRVIAGLGLGRLQDSAGDYQGAEATLRRSYRDAIVAGMPEQAAAAARALVNVVGGSSGLMRPADGRAWAFHAEALTEAVGTPEDHADYLMHLGNVAKMDGAYAEAREHFEQALEQYEALRLDHPDAITAITQLASVATFQGEIEQALVHYQRALSLLQRTRDPSHPDIGRMYLSLGELASQDGRYADARAYLESAVANFEAALGPEHPLLGYTLGSLGYVAGWQGDFASGRAQLERSIRIIEASVGHEHYYYADAQEKLGALAFFAGDYTDAGAHYELARASLERQMGPTHYSVGIALGNLAELALVERAYALALERADAALAILEPKLGPEHIDLLLALDTRGQALLELGRPSEAIEPLRRVLGIRDRDEPRNLALIRFALARALLDSGGDRDEARGLAEQARDAYAVDDSSRAAIEAWLGEIEHSN
jgi:tetratricopeptide (TPR) repeat protein/tRNA A-37 threonylcarbamoyl transferase component Bud32